MTETAKVIFEGDTRPLQTAGKDARQILADLNHAVEELGADGFPLQEEFVAAAEAAARLQTDIEGLRSDQIEEITAEVHTLFEELERVAHAEPFEGQEDEARRLALQITSAATSAASLAREAAAAGVKLSQAEQARFDGLRDQLRDLNSEFLRIRQSADFDPASQEAKRLEGSINAVTAEILQLAQKGSQQSEVLRRSLKLVDSSIEEIGKEARRAGSDLEGIGKKGAGGLRGLVSRLGTIQGLLGSLTVGARLVEGVRLVSASIDALQAKSQLLRGLTVSLAGDNRAAAAEYEFLGKTVDELGFRLASLQNDYLQVTAAAQGTGVSQREIRELFLGTLEAGRALGKTTTDLSGIFQAYSQILSKPTVQTEELLQIAERFPGTFNRLAAALGTTAGALQDDLRGGVLKARDVLVPFGRALREEFGEAARLAADDFDAAAARIENTAERLKVAFAEGFAQPLSSLAEQGSAQLKQQEESARGLGRSLGFVLETAGLLFALEQKRLQQNADLLVGYDRQGDRVEAVSAALGRLLIQQNALEAGSGNLAQAQNAVIKALVAVQLNGGATAEQLDRIDAAISTVTQGFIDAGKEIPVPLARAIEETFNLRRELGLLGDEGPSALDSVGAAADGAADRLAGLSEGARAVITGIEAEQKKLEDQTRSLVEAFRFLSDQQQINTQVGRALAEEVEAQVQRYEEVPPALAAVADALGVGGERAEEVSEKLSEVASTFTAARDAFEEGLPLEGLEAARDTVRSLKEDVEGLTRLQELQTKARLDIDELNELNELSFKIPTSLDLKGQALRQQLADNTGFEEDGLSVPVEFQPAGLDQIEAAISRLQGRGRLTDPEREQLEALEAAAATARGGLEAVTEAEEEFQDTQRLTNDLLEQGNRGFRGLTEGTARFRRAGVGAGDAMEDLGGAAERTGETFESAGIRISAAGERTAESIARQQESIAILQRLKERMEASGAAASAQAEATQAGARAAGEYQDAAGGVSDTLDSQTDAAKRAGDAGQEAGEKGAKGSKRAEEAARDHLRVLEDIEETAGRVTEAIAQLGSRGVVALTPLLQVCEQVRDCLRETGA